MQKLLIGLLTLSTAALAAICLYQHKQLGAIKEQTRAAQESLRVETDSNKAAAARIKELERTEARLEKQVQDFTKVTTTLRSSEAAQSSNLTAMAQQMAAVRNPAKNGAGAAGSGGMFGKGMGDMINKMMKDPAMRDMLRDQQKASIKMMYSGLFKELNLSPEEKDKFSALLTDAQMRNIEAAQGMFGDKKDTAATQETVKQMEEAKKQSDSDIKALLGDDRFQQYTDYQKNITERMQIDQFSTRLQSANLPLQDQQVSQLYQIMKEEKAAVPPVIPSDATQTGKNLALLTSDNLDRQVQWLDDYNRRVLDRVGTVLTPDQVKEFRDFQDSQTSLQKMGLQMARQMFGDKNNAAPAAGTK